MPTGRRVHGPKALGIVGLVFLLLGLGGLVLAGTLAGIEYRSKRSAGAGGTILAASYRPVVQFTTARGEVIRFTNFVHSSFWKDGDAVAVAYDPAAPTDAAIDGVTGRWFFAFLAAVIAGPFFTFGLVLALVAWFS